MKWSKIKNFKDHLQWSRSFIRSRSRSLPIHFIPIKISSIDPCGFASAKNNKIQSLQSLASHSSLLLSIILLIISAKFRWIVAQYGLFWKCLCHEGHHNKLNWAKVHQRLIPRCKMKFTTKFVHSQASFRIMLRCDQGATTLAFCFDIILLCNESAIMYAFGSVTLQQTGSMAETFCLLSQPNMVGF